MAELLSLMRRCHTLVPRRPATSGEVGFTFTVPVDTVHGPETRHPGIVICERQRPVASERNLVGHLTRWEAAGKDNLVVRFLPSISSDIFQVSGIEGYRMPSIHPWSSCPNRLSRGVTMSPRFACGASYCYRKSPRLLLEGVPGLLSLS